jgi:hypothetical protein
MSAGHCAERSSPYRRQALEPTELDIAMPGVKRRRLETVSIEIDPDTAALTRNLLDLSQHARAKP